MDVNLLDLNLLDWFGYLASLVVLISLLTSSILKLRWINLFGAAMFATYGFLIGSLPTAVMNAGIVIIDIYYLIKIYSSKEYFQILEFTPGSNYFNSFMLFHKEEIGTYFGQTEYKLEADTVGFYVLRNMMPASLFLGKPLSKNKLSIQLDFAVPAYRDFKIGKYIYDKHTEFFLSHGYEILEATAVNEHHEKYLLKMGFEKEDQHYIKRLK